MSLETRSAPLAAAPPHQQARAITPGLMLGILAATVLRIIFAMLTTQLLGIIGLLLAGGVLLFWVCWKMWRELRTSHAEETDAQEALEGADLDADGKIAGVKVLENKDTPGLGANAESTSASTSSFA